MKKIYLLLSFLLAAGYAADAQNFAIKRVERAGDVINIYYDLLDTAKMRTYTVELFGTRENTISKLEKVSGDVGLEVSPGADHIIVWNAKEELGPSFDGKIRLEVRGVLFVSIVKMEPLKRSYKRGKKILIKWTGGSKQSVFSFDLYKGKENVFRFPNITNTGETSLLLSTGIKTGDDYYFKITDRRSKEPTALTTSFAVKHKIPTLLKALPVAIIAAIVSTMGGKSGGSDDIPDPLRPTGIH